VLINFVDQTNATNHYTTPPAGNLIVCVWLILLLCLSAPCGVYIVGIQLAAFDVICAQMLQDVQERLVFRTHIYIRQEILNYNPASGDLAYPSKLEMMEVCRVVFTLIDHIDIIIS